MKKKIGASVAVGLLLASFDSTTVLALGKKHHSDPNGNTNPPELTTYKLQASKTFGTDPTPCQAYVAMVSGFAREESDYNHSFNSFSLSCIQKDQSPNIALQMEIKVPSDFTGWREDKFQMVGREFGSSAECNAQLALYANPAIVLGDPKDGLIGLQTMCQGTNGKYHFKLSLIRTR